MNEHKLLLHGGGLVYVIPFHETNQRGRHRKC